MFISKPNKPNGTSYGVSQETQYYEKHRAFNAFVSMAAHWNSDNQNKQNDLNQQEYVKRLRSLFPILIVIGYLENICKDGN